MRLATLRDGTSDGRLLVLATDGVTATPSAAAITLQHALERWQSVSHLLLAEASVPHGPIDLPSANIGAPMPRAWQWLDGSAYPEHGRLMQQAFNLPPIETDRPLMYQGMSDRFLGPEDPVALPSEDDGIDFEGEFGVIVDAVPMGTSPADALERIRLIVQINDWSLRTIAPVEMKTGFGWVQAKPACSMAPFAVTPEALGAAWSDGRIDATLEIDWNGVRFGRVNGRDEMAFGFHELVAHAARTRDLVAGTIIGSGTLSTTRWETLGSSCISEARAIDVIHGREPRAFMRFGDHVQMTGKVDEVPMFGVIDQRVTRRST
jgi:fumarylacetoacetate (FAA) hydrolase